MIKNISIKQYRKLKNIDFEFKKGINVLSGSNGTCKTSILHIISNSFKAINKKTKFIKDINCVDMLKDFNDSINPKIETLTKGDKKYNDPAKGHKGTLYEVLYLDGTKLCFRRHNSNNIGKNRYSIKPSYKKGKGESLIDMPVIYLGLSRLYAYGEYNKEENIESININLPQKYLEDIAKIYKDFTGINIFYKSQQKLADIKTRSEFSTNIEGIDSNTISAGEDNLFIIITALISLKYYFCSIDSKREVESIFLMDEFDATLHPSYQLKLLNLLKEYSEKYKIQIIFTTHSLFLLEESLKKKFNVIYLIDFIDKVKKMDNVDIYRIKMHLENKTINQISSERCIPVFTEDDEARLFLECIFNYFNKINDSFSKIRQLFFLVDANISSEALYNIFSSGLIVTSAIRSICVLDGDQYNRADYTKYTIVLPGEKAPEQLVFEYVEKIYKDNNEFWNSQFLLDNGYTKVYCRDNILKDIKNIDKNIQEIKNKGGSVKGIRREENKKVFREYEKFFKFVIEYWISDSNNKQQIDKFYEDLRIMFKKVSDFHDISSKEWE